MKSALAQISHTGQELSKNVLVLNPVNCQMQKWLVTYFSLGMSSRSHRMTKWICRTRMKTSHKQLNSFPHKKGRPVYTGMEEVITGMEEHTHTRHSRTLFRAVLAEHLQKERSIRLQHIICPEISTHTTHWPPPEVSAFLLCVLSASSLVPERIPTNRVFSFN